MVKIYQITLRELIKDPLYRKWFQTVPRLPKDIGHTPPWRVYVQKASGGSWARLELRDYPKAYRFVATHLKEYHDLCIQSKRHEFRPPVVRDKATNKKHYWPSPVGHQWCPYCRRPTVFAYFARHHLFSGRVGFNGAVTSKRCLICGIRQSSVRKYDTPLISTLRGWEPDDPEED